MFGSAASGGAVVAPSPRAPRSAACRPAPWLAPIAATSSAAQPLGGLGRAVTPASVSAPSSKVSSATIGSVETLRTASIAVVELVEVVERLDHEQVDAAALEHRAPARRRARRAGRRERRRASPSGPIEPAMKTSRPETSRASRASFTPGALIRSSSSSRKMRRELAPVGAERVRLDQLGAGADEARVQRHDALRRAQVRLLGAAQARDGARDERAHAAVGDDRPGPRRGALERLFMRRSTH